MRMMRKRMAKGMRRETRRKNEKGSCEGALVFYGDGLEVWYYVTIPLFDDRIWGEGCQGICCSATKRFQNSEM